MTTLAMPRCGQSRSLLPQTPTAHWAGMPPGKPGAGCYRASWWRRGWVAAWWRSCDRRGPRVSSYYTVTILTSSRASAMPSIDLQIGKVSAIVCGRT